MKFLKYMQGAAAILAVLYTMCSLVGAESIAPKESRVYRVPGLCCMPPVLKDFECSGFNGERYPINLQCAENSNMIKSRHNLDDDVPILAKFK